jgi:hypothetical protein
MSNQHNKKDNRQLIVIAVSLWISFLSAGAATILFFSTFDPTVLAQVATFPMNMDRSSGYSVGFLLFWLLLVINSLVVNWLLKRRK